MKALLLVFFWTLSVSASDLAEADLPTPVVSIKTTRHRILSANVQVSVGQDDRFTITTLTPELKAQSRNRYSLALSAPFSRISPVLGDELIEQTVGRPTLTAYAPVLDDDDSRFVIGARVKGPLFSTDRGEEESEPYRIWEIAPMLETEWNFRGGIFIGLSQTVSYNTEYTYVRPASAANPFDTGLYFQRPIVSETELSLGFRGQANSLIATYGSDHSLNRARLVTTGFGENQTEELWRVDFSSLAVKWIHAFSDASVLTANIVKSLNGAFDEGSKQMNFDDLTRSADLAGSVSYAYSF